MTDAPILPIELAGIEIDPATETIEGFTQDEAFSENPNG